MNIRETLVRFELSIQAVGTSEGATKGWDTRGRHTPESFDKHAENFSKLKSQKEEVRYRNQNVKSWEKKAWSMKSSESERNLAKKMLQQGREHQHREEKQYEDTKAVVREGDKLQHPEAGQFVRQPNVKTLGGHLAVWNAPSGDTVTHSHFGGWSMQRVAPNDSVTFRSSRTNKDYSREWSGHSGHDSATNHLQKSYGITS